MAFNSPVVSDPVKANAAAAKFNSLPNFVKVFVKNGPKAAN